MEVYFPNYTNEVDESFYFFKNEAYMIHKFNNISIDEKEKEVKNIFIIYEGDFINGKYEGNGTQMCGTDHYIGQYKNGKREGKGIIYYKKNKIKYEGDFHENKMEGKGKYIFDDDSYTIGEFKNNKKMIKVNIMIIIII